MIAFYEKKMDSKDKLLTVLGATGGLSGATSAAYLRKQLRDKQNKKQLDRKDKLQDIKYTVAGAVPIIGGIANHKTIKAINKK
jgi:hypothetical protein